MKVILFFGICLLCAVSAMSQGQEKVITVMGKGSISTEPNLAFITIGASYTKNTTREAMDATKKAMNEIVKICRQMGIHDSDLQTEMIAVERQYTWVNNTNKFTGFIASSNIQITIRKIDSLPILTERVLTTDATHLNNVRFSHSKLDSLRSAASVLAIDDARYIAASMCRKINAKLGEITYLSNFEPPQENSGGGAAFDQREIMTKSMGFAAARAPAPESLPVKPGRIELQNVVYVKFKFGY